jgi:L-alanine-DL-glutamate epimerase-like enolase superfamily enzyme
MALIEALEFIPVSVPYTRDEVSTLVKRAGVTDIIVRATDSKGNVGWGESASGADVKSVLNTLHSMKPFVLGRSPWTSEAIRADLWKRAIWQYRKPTACFAYAGIDMALWDICGKQCGQPLYRLLGGLARERVNYYFYLDHSSVNDVYRQGRDGIEAGYTVFYLKVGIDVAREVEMVRALREAIGPDAKIRLDANGAWRVSEALRIIGQFEPYGIDFIEQPVSPEPMSNMQEVRTRSTVALSANEGMWSSEAAYQQIKSRTADVYCFSPYWVGSLLEFRSLSMVAHFEGFQVCRHSHGELGIAAAAFHHVCLTLPNLVDGNQQTAQIMREDVVRPALPIASSPYWGVPEEPGISVEVDERSIAKYHEAYCRQGQFLPYDRSSVESNTPANELQPLSLLEKS